MKVVAILQARKGSTRLPGKVLMPLAGKSMLANIVERVVRAKRLNDAVVAVPSWKEAQHLDEHLCSVFADDGVDENDLVGRYLACAEAYCADLIVRVPCDNPCVDPEYIDEAIGHYLDEAHIFYSNTTCLILDQLVDGVGAEVFSISRLKWLDRVTKGMADYREHPHKCFYDYPNGSTFCNATKDVLRLDVNTKYDYDFITNIYGYFGHNHFNAQEILNCPPVQERLHGR